MSEVSPPTPDQRWLRCRNGDTVPLESYGLAKITGATVAAGRVVLEVKRPKKSDAYTEALVALGPASMAEGRIGWCTFDWPSWVRYDTAQQPAAGELWGPQDDSTRLKQGAIGFLTLGTGVAQPDRVLVDHRPHYRKANWIRFELPSGGLTTSMASIANCSVVHAWDGFSPGETVTVYNIELAEDWLFEGDAGDVGLAFYDPNEDRYHMMQMECPQG
ncbi:MAG: hypothetical protein RIC55_21410 [Pirellulaceae bacterium]